ncbi:MAG: GNAT family N-acetyltransferase [Promethearchaeota archaeon]|nr:MAG: GNAT family N-acetyltransferase [Candidatus Lokiarchaeota archaeon]
MKFIITRAIDIEDEKLKIVKLKIKHIIDLNKSNDPFLIYGKIIPIFDGSDWIIREQISKSSYEKQYAVDDINASEYIENENKAVFLSYLEKKCVGQIRVRKNWNGYCLIEDISVSQDHRRQGIGRALIQKAIEWAKEKKLGGLMLETQDNNLSACRFYFNVGFKIGAVDTMLYANTEHSNEKAVFMYYRF